MRPRCPEHGLVINRPDAKKCPACGGDLIHLNFRLFSIYISGRSTAILALVIATVGLFATLDVDGCIVGCKEQDRLQAIVDAEDAEVQRQRSDLILQTLPAEWRTLFVALEAMSVYDRSGAAIEYLKKHLDMPALDNSQSRLFFALFHSNHVDNVLPHVPDAKGRATR